MEKIRALSAIDFLDGKVTRQIDYWDLRGSPIIGNRAPESVYPTALGFNKTLNTPNPELEKVVRQLDAAMAAGNANATAELFSSDAVFEDFALRTREEGRLAIGRYLERSIAQLPYGSGFEVTIRNILGCAQGGGYEWETNGLPVRNGITALELNGDGFITRLSAIWDSSLASDSAIQALSVLAIEK